MSQEQLGSWDITMKIFLAVTLILSVFISACAACEPCASDETCGTTNCVCNPNNYTNTGQSPSPKYDCIGGKLNVYVSKCWLERNKYESTTIRLLNSTCLATREIVNDTALMTLHRPLSTSDCGTTARTNTTHVIYANTLYIYAKKTIIQTRNDVFVNMSCAFPLFTNVSLNVTLKPVIGSTVINGPNSETSIPVNMVLYKEDTFNTLISVDDPLYVDDTVYLSVFIPNLNVQTFLLKVLSIVASSGESGSSYDLLTNGCPASGVTAGLLSVRNNGNSSEARFSMKVFQITGSSYVNISAVVQICTKNCQTDCSTVGRAASSQDNTAVVSVSVSAEDRIEVNSADCFSMTWTLSSILLSLLLAKLV